MEVLDAGDLVRSTLLLALLLAAPVLAVALLVALVMSVLQALTQIQEHTLSFVPKLAAMVVAAVLLMPWMTHRLMEFSAAMFTFGRGP